MPTANTCRKCGQPLGGMAGAIFCARCLFLEALEPAATQSEANAGAAAGPKNDPWSAPINRGEWGENDLLEEIGRGGMGVVYRARQRSLERVVAIKVMAIDAGAGTALLQRFRKEAMSAASLQHPNIVAIHEVGWHAEKPFLVMDYVDGKSLAQTVGNHPLPAQRAAGLLRTIAAAVHYAHEQGILHRDLKPANVLIDSKGQPRVVDFGLARRLVGDAQLTLAGQVLGSPQYLPPEQAAGRPESVSRQTDVYGLGAMLYHLLTGRPPHQSDSVVHTLELVLHAEPVAPCLLNPKTPRDLETICLKCLQKDPAKRYATAQELIDDLDRFLCGDPIQARPVSRPERLWRWCVRQPVRATLVAALIAVSCLGVGGILWQWRRADTARQRAELAEREARERLRASFFAEGRANRSSERAGRRFSGLAALSNAAALRPSPELRDEAIACLALADVQVARWLPVQPGLKTTGLAVDAQFRHYALALDDSTLQICTLEGQRELRRLRTPGVHGRVGLSFSPNGRFLALRSEAAQVSIFEVASGEVALGRSLLARTVSFTPDNKEVAIGEAGGAVHVYDLERREERVRFSAGPGLNHVVFDPTGQRLAVSRSARPTLAVLEAGSWRVEEELNDVDEIGLPAWAPDGEILAAPSDDGRVYLWSWRTGEKRALAGHTAAAKGAIFNHAGDLLVSVGWDGMSRFWDPGALRLLVSTRGTWVLNGFAADDRHLCFSLSESEVGIWEVATGRERHELGSTGALWDAAFSPNGRMLATASDDGVRIWGLPGHQIVARWPVVQARSVTWTADGQGVIACGASGVQACSFSADRSEWDIRSLFPEPCERGVIAPDQHALLVTGSDAADLLALDLQTNRPPHLLNGHARAAWIAVSPNGQWFATGTWQGTGIKVWSMTSLQPVLDLPVRGSAACAFSPDSAWLVSGSADEYCFWRVGTWVRAFALPRDRVGDTRGAMVFSPDGQVMAVLRGRNTEVALVSSPDGRELARLDTGAPLAFSPDSTHLVTAGENRRSLFIWDLALIRQELRPLKLDWEARASAAALRNP